MSAPFEPGSEQMQTYYKNLVEMMVEHARAAGVVITIEQKPLAPLAMGHHESVVSVRAAR